MSKVHDNSTPKMILGMCWGTCVWSLAIPHQACKILGNIPVEKDKLHTVARCLDIWSWKRHKISVGILLGPQGLLILRDILLYYFFFICSSYYESLFFVDKKTSKRFVWKLNFLLNSLSNWCEQVIESICDCDWVIDVFFIISDYGWHVIVFMLHWH